MKSASPKSLYLVEGKLYLCVTRFKQKDGRMIFQLHYCVHQHKILLWIISVQYWIDSNEIMLNC